MKFATRITELGKIRIGDQVETTNKAGEKTYRPRKLSVFRLTSNNLMLLKAAATIYGGEAQEWVHPADSKTTRPDHKYQLYTTTNTLRIVVSRQATIETMREKWRNGFLVRQCDGEYILRDADDKSLCGRECVCPVDPSERTELAKSGRACQEVSRITVMLAELPWGRWRLDTRGHHGASEIRGLQEYLQMLPVSTPLLEAHMILEPRTARKLVNGKPRTYNFVVPVIMPLYTPREFVALTKGQEPVALLSAPESSLGEDLAAVFGGEPSDYVDAEAEEMPEPTGRPPVVDLDMDAPPEAKAAAWHRAFQGLWSTASAYNCDHGRVTTWVKKVWKVKTPRDLALSQLLEATDILARQALLPEQLAWLKKQPVAGSADPEAVAVDIRERVHELLQTGLAKVEQARAKLQEGDALLEDLVALEEHCTHAQALVEDPDTPVDVLEAKASLIADLMPAGLVGVAGGQ